MAPNLVFTLAKGAFENPANAMIGKAGLFHGESGFIPLRKRSRKTTARHHTAPNACHDTPLAPNTCHDTPFGRTLVTARVLVLRPRFSITLAQVDRRDTRARVTALETHGV
jgi:hypothetical protein